MGDIPNVAENLRKLGASWMIQQFVVKPCHQCGTDFVVPFLQRWLKWFCCLEHQFQWRREIHSGTSNPNYKGGRTITCQTCGKTKRLRYKHYRHKFCSRICARARRIGALAPAWKGGTSTASQRFRASKIYALWREAVFARDDFTCQSCGKRGGKLTAHHIKTFAAHPDLRLEVSNGITLCRRPCHSGIKGREIESESRFLEKLAA